MAELDDGDGQDYAPAEVQDIKALRRELRRMRRGREILGMRVKKARRELARTRKRQKEAEKGVMENEAAVAVISQRLGCAAEGLPEIDEWRVIMTEHKLREKELDHQIMNEKEAHEERVKQLEEELKKGGRPETAKSLEAAETRAKRWAADERCGRIQAVRDYLKGELEGISLEELRELVRPPDAEGAEKEEEEDGVALGLRQYDELLRAALEELREGHEQAVRDARRLCNLELGRRDALLKALAYNVLTRGLEDIKLCTPTERGALRELLKDVESVCSSRLRAGEAAH
uniref:Uncharacterized protein n=1 Tax=Alexandrium catenella TaxID=2925 RepID=A0A7S1WS71_ALECA|mmetsp:Transcript_8471/g.23018  ORF Transcript_8471/g.23018 Transcript_8471/m.23018 type:complete len:289 (+) Transcript_8471:122-988(+)|eukprot:CAMPEP_0171202378 /NCGR_PEP_ID=MMETSP0790-20130122/24969_1 /TAXON_ID=2925 /ORGANISM="Alexandrium catenella, Strain OF101" /LENGTH=288 /DNA_ID=CAMNT_0011667795 /DNA_START=121 /DNA_END=987 /DNA_ORIENTATION=-